MWYSEEDTNMYGTGIHTKRFDMKKLVSILLILGIFLGLTACKGQTTGAPSTGSPSADSTESDAPHSSPMLSDERIPVTAVRINADSLTLGIGDETTLTASVLPENATNPNISWSSSNKTVATVDNSGEVTAVSAGKARITAKSEDGGYTASCTVTVSKEDVAVIGVILDKSALQMKAGASEKLTATVLPQDAKNRNVIWKSSDPTVVKVENGVLTALRSGTATITVTTEEGANKASCVVSVLDNDDPMDNIDLSEAQEIWDLGGYNGGLRLKSSNEILFSPNLNELRERIFEDSDYKNYLGYIRFTYIPEDEDEVEFTYHSIILTPQKSKGAWVDFYLQGNEIDCGFCPIAGAIYRIELIIVSTAEPTKGLLNGTYTVSANEDIENSPYYAPTPLGGQTIREEGQFFIRYAVSGRGGFITGETKQLLNKGQGSSEVIAVPNEGFQFVMWSDGVKTAARSGDKVTEDTKIYAYFTVVTVNSNIAEMFITTQSGKPVTTQEYQNATMLIKGADDEQYNISASLQIRGRGNSSWNGGAPQTSYDSKNSYRLKFDEKLKLLGVGDSKNRDWVLQSNKFDLSGLRNWLVWDLANKMGTIPYVPECTWIQLYINNEYRGMYMVCELVEVANDRVEIDDSVASTDKGYFLEFDFRGSYDDNPYFYIDGYGTSPEVDLHGAVEFVIKSEVAGDEDIEFIKNYILRCHNAILHGDRQAINNLIDIPSLIDMFILEELSKDCDVGRASFFVQKSAGGKLYFTAPWDFDFGFGTYGPATNNNGLVSETNDACVWYGALIQQQWFRAEVLNRMNELSKDFTQTLEDVRNKSAELEGAADANAFLWDLYGTYFHPYVSGQVSGHLYSYKEHIDFLVNWSKERWENMLQALDS